MTLVMWISRLPILFFFTGLSLSKESTGNLNYEDYSGYYHSNAENGKEFIKKDQLPEKFPWLVVIMKSRDYNGRKVCIPQCGGSLIHRRAVLTSAHCVVDYRTNIQLLNVRTGFITYSTDAQQFDQDRDITEIIIHPDYNSTRQHKNVAILILSEPVELGRNVNTIDLVENDTEYSTMNCMLNYWFKYSRTIHDNPVQNLKFSIYTNCITDSATGMKQSEDFVCGNIKTINDTCQCGGGSPLFCPLSNDHEKFVQVGISVWDLNSKGEGYQPVKFINVKNFYDWINNIINPL